MMQRPEVKLSREFYTRSDTLQIARELLGKLLMLREPGGSVLSGMIVEVEAYMAPEDKASHAFGLRRTKRTEVMFAVGGTAYVYFVYGMYDQFNVVTNEAGIPHAILVRAVEPVQGLERMRKNRPVRKPQDLTNGPGKLCQAMGIDRCLNGADLLGDKVWIEEGQRVRPEEIASGPRIGIAYAEEYVHMPWRFWIRNNPYVSRKLL